MRAGSEYQLAGTIEKEVGGEIKSLPVRAG
ncbi:HlyU family transcriptional regulator [Devosia algicola]|uniref:HlyU family transcriptional regulator n=1 Tax=Devosia algicola TaxID=3026418 RepID=A0ABY7YS91_9HYPH|nr:HlyU family transcriptional regulator [Devosia algicola]